MADIISLQFHDAAINMDIEPLVESLGGKQNSYVELVVDGGPAPDIRIVVKNSGIPGVIGPDLEFSLVEMIERELKEARERANV